jgi:hypothetical protein
MVDGVETSVCGQVEDLVKMYEEYEHSVDLTECFIRETGARRIDKLMCSLKSHGFEAGDAFYSDLMGRLTRSTGEEK